MSIEILKARMTAFTELSVKVYARIKLTKNSLESLIAKYGESHETVNLVKQFYEMKIDEIELLIIILNGIITNENFKRIESLELSEKMNELKKRLENDILEAKVDLAEHSKIKKTTKKSISNTKTPLSTRTLMKKLGIG